VCSVKYTTYENSGGVKLQQIDELLAAVNHGVKHPGAATDEGAVMMTRLMTPLGPMLAGASGAGICLLEFMDRRMLEAQLRRIRQRFRAQLKIGSSEHFDLLDVQLQEYFSAARKTFTVPMDTPGTEFQTRAWTALQTIPYGETRSYEEQAFAVGRPTAVRAVARANGDNRISIVIPCHRVIGKDGSLTGYGGKLWRKQWLLQLESVSHRQGSLFQSPVPG
jgi:AraC family transcriptional regulator of adaptative response/methylated-DNA-[protein]-cysteine methyltransferase